MRTEDLNRYEELTRLTARGEAVDPAELEEVLQATRHSRDAFEQRVAFHQARAGQAADLHRPVTTSELERYQEEAKVMGLHEGLFIVVVPVLMTLVLLGFATYLVLQKV